jgi:hypothetical protein
MRKKSSARLTFQNKCVNFNIEMFHAIFLNNQIYFLIPNMKLKEKIF